MKAVLLSRRFLAIAVTLLFLGATLTYFYQNADAKTARKKGWIGVSVQELTPSLRDAMKLGDRTGLLINNVVENSPAEDAGLREEDVILEFNGQKVERTKALSRLVRQIDPGTEVKVKIFRDGDENTIDLTVGRLSSSRSGVYSFGSGNNVFFLGHRPMLGVQIHDMDDDLAAYFKVNKNEGVLILGVNEDSPAAAAGLKSGDVILKIDNEPAGNYEDLMDILTYYEDGDEVEVEYMRQGSKNTVTVALEATGTSSWSGFIAPDAPRMRWRSFGRDRKDINIVIPELHERMNNLRGRIIELRDRANEEKERQRLLIRDNIRIYLGNTI